jgi:S1-C subfamily serine protease
MEGIRYHFVMSPDRIAFFKNRSVLEHARVTVVSGHPRVTGLTDDVQPAARILKPGDEITAIGGIEIHDVRMMLSTLKAIKPGRRVEVRFRRPNSATEQRFLAEGGRLLGVRVK